MHTWLWTDDGTGRVKNPELSDDEYQAGLDELAALNLAVLWQTAHDLEYNSISGSAVGLLTLGVQKQLPKCIAVMAWIQSIWTLYYINKPKVSFLFDVELLDFSSCGEMPHSVPELMQEVFSG